jgi:diacylglycerol kinase family enzyme
LHAAELSAEFVREHLADESLDPDLKTRLPLIVIGGDGLIHECVNGAMAELEKARSSDAPQIRVESLKIDLGIIPCGSGNAIAVSLGIFSVDDAIQRILSFVKGSANYGSSSKPLNISSVHVAPPPEKNLPSIGDIWPKACPLTYSCVVVSFGLHAQIVKQSEYLRPYMGNERFSVSYSKHGELFINV